MGESFLLDQSEKALIIEPNTNSWETYTMVKSAAFSYSVDDQCIHILPRLSQGRGHEESTNSCILILHKSITMNY